MQCRNRSMLEPMLERMWKPEHADGTLPNHPWGPMSPPSFAGVLILSPGSLFPSMWGNRCGRCGFRRGWLAIKTLCNNQNCKRGAPDTIPWQNCGGLKHPNWSKQRCLWGIAARKYLACSEPTQVMANGTGGWSYIPILLLLCVPYKSGRCCPTPFLIIRLDFKQTCPISGASCRSIWNFSGIEIHSKGTTKQDVPSIKYMFGGDLT